MNRTLALSAVLSLTAAASHASITGVGGMTTWLGTSPPNAQMFNLGGPFAYAWDEQQGRSVTSLPVNIVTNGTFTGFSPYTAVYSGPCDSHMIHADTFGNPAPVTGSVSFNGNIVAVIFDETKLSNTDLTLGSPGTIYDTGNFFRSFNSDILGNSALTIIGNTIHFNFLPLAGAHHMFEVRVLTQVPTPGSLALLGLGGVCAVRRRTR